MRESGSDQSEIYVPEMGSHAEEIKPRQSGSRGALQGIRVIQFHSSHAHSPCFTDVKYSETGPVLLIIKRLLSLLLDRRVADTVRPP